jgi:hypothetical protein
VRTITVRLPAVYFRIMDTEATRIGVSRGSFLTMLLRWKDGTVQFGRPDGAPSYETTEAELSETQTYVWQIGAELLNTVDLDRLRMGNLSLPAYITQLLNHWLGCPMGLALKGEGKRR